MSDVVGLHFHSSLHEHKNKSDINFWFPNFYWGMKVILRWRSIKKLGTGVSSQLAWCEKEARHREYAPRGTLWPGGLRCATCIATSLVRFCSASLLRVITTTPPPHFPSFPSLSTFKIKAKMFDNSRFFPPPYPRDIRYTRLKGLEKFALNRKKLSIGPEQLWVNKQKQSHGDPV